MSDTTMEKETLLEKKSTASESAIPSELSGRKVNREMQPEERDWDGHLLSLCGSCDHNGVSTFAYVKLLSPLAWG